MADSGAYAHITRKREYFKSLQSIQPESIVVGNGMTVLAKHMGVIDVEGFNGSHWEKTTLNDVRFVPGCGSVNLFSLAAATKRG